MKVKSYYRDLRGQTQILNKMLAGGAPSKTHHIGKTEKNEEFLLPTGEYPALKSLLDICKLKPHIIKIVPTRIVSTTCTVFYVKRMYNSIQNL